MKYSKIYYDKKEKCYRLNIKPHPPYSESDVLTEENVISIMTRDLKGKRLSKKIIEYACFYMSFAEQCSKTKTNEILWHLQCLLLPD